MKSLTLPFVLFTLTLSLVTIGIISVYSASISANYMLKQVGFAACGLLLMLGGYQLDYNLLRRHALKLMLVALALCLLVFIPHLGWANTRHAHRWVMLGPFRFQSSEFAKLAVVIYIAKMLSDRRREIKNFFSGVLPAMIVTGLFAAIIVIEPDFGAAFTLCLTVFGMWFAAGMSGLHLAGLISFIIPAGVLAFRLQPYRVQRALAFAQYLFSPKTVDKELVRGVLYQLIQSLTAVGSGGLWGLGLGESHQKYHYLSEPHSDFIFAIMCEEFGFVRVLGILVLYAALILLGWRIAWRTTDLFGSLLASGITLMFLSSAAIHMAVVLGLLPTKGLVLPFFSAGGSSLLVCMAAVGILMNIARSQFAYHGVGWDGT